jgi:hypothetical protein
MERRVRTNATVRWEPSGGGTGWRGTGSTGQTYLLRRAGGRSWRLWIAGTAYGPFASLEAAKADAERRERHSVHEPLLEDRAPSRDELTVFFDASADRAYGEADKVAQVVERTLGYPEGRWRLEPFDQGWRMRYGPFDRGAFRDVEGALVRRFGNAVRVSYTTVREERLGPSVQEAPSGRGRVWSHSFGATERSDSRLLLEGAPRAVATVDTRPGINRGPDDWRVIDNVRKIRTPWMSGNIPNRTDAIIAAKLAVKRTDPAKLTHRHTRDGEWIIVHSL